MGSSSHIKHDLVDLLKLCWQWMQLELGKSHPVYQILRIRSYCSPNIYWWYYCDRGWWTRKLWAQALPGQGVWKQGIKRVKVFSGDRSSSFKIRNLYLTAKIYK